MECDWEVEIGGSAPVIDTCWEGFVDLRQAPERACELAEARDLSAIANALMRLNTPSSSVWTSKCDVWRADPFDPDELDAPAGAGKYAMACYIDLLSRGKQQWADPDQAVAFCRQICATLRSHPIRCCRADFIVRRAWIEPGRPDLGITVYVTACGVALEDARTTLGPALAAVVDAVLRAAPAPKLQ